MAEIPEVEVPAGEILAAEGIPAAGEIPALEASAEAKPAAAVRTEAGRLITGLPEGNPEEKSTV